MPTHVWDTAFLRGDASQARTRALIILNQPFSIPLLERLWKSTSWHCCADGGANRLSDVLGERRGKLLPDLIKGDLDSLRPDVKEYYQNLGVTVTYDDDQDSTDLMKCVAALEEKELAEGAEHDLIILGGLSGRLDQTVHTLSYLHKLRRTRRRVFAVSDENVGWVLDEGEHEITIDHALLGQTCGLLPVGIDHTVLTTRGLRWNLTDHKSSFDGLVSTSNHLDPAHGTVYVRTTKPIWWTAELRV